MRRSRAADGLTWRAACASEPIEENGAFHRCAISAGREKLPWCATVLLLRPDSTVHKEQAPPRRLFGPRRGKETSPLFHLVGNQRRQYDRPVRSSRNAIDSQDLVHGGQLSPAPPRPCLYRFSPPTEIRKANKSAGTDAHFLGFGSLFESGVR